MRVLRHHRVTAEPRAARAWGEAAARATTSGDGTFRSGGLPDGVFDVAPRCASRIRTRFQVLPARREGVPPGTTDVEFVLAPALSIEGVVVDGDGHAAAPVPLPQVDFGRR